MWICDRKQWASQVLITGAGVACVCMVFSGCVQVESAESFRFGAWGLHGIQGDVNNCTLQYAGADVDTLTGEASYFAEAGSESSANQVLAQLSADLVVKDGVASASCLVTNEQKGRIDLRLSGPRYLDTALYAPSGALDLTSVSGVHDWHARNIKAYDVEGDVHLLSSQGEADLSLLPLANSEIFLELLETNLQLALPKGLSYDLQVWGSPATVVSVSGLSFEKSRQEPGFFAGASGDGDIKIRVEMTGGSAIIRSR